MTAQKKTDRRRNAELAKIHIGKKELGMDEATYRDMLETHGGARSAGQLSASGRRAVLDYLAACGFSAKKPAGKTRGRPHNMDRPGSRARQMAKIEALLTVGAKPWGYADAIAQRVCKVDKLAWADTEDLGKVIAALRYQARREGWDLSGER